jgi:hypothetical protein
MEQQLANVAACAEFVRIGYKRLAREMLGEGHVMAIFEAHAQKLINTDEAVKLLMLHRTPWYVRMWWRHGVR